MKLLKLLAPTIITITSLASQVQADNLQAYKQINLPISQSQEPTEPQNQNDYNQTNIQAILNQRDKILEVSEIKYKK